MTGERVHPHLVVARRGAVLEVRVDREEALGALSRSILEALRDLLTGLATDDSVRVLVLTGTGKGFIAGADIGEYDGMTRDGFDAYQRLGRTVFDAVAALPQFTVAAVNGYALGGGFEIALCCDVIVAGEQAKFGLPEVNLGLIPGGGGTQRLSRALGTRFTKELVATGRMVRAAEMASRGLLSAVHPQDELLPAARELAETIASRAPLAVRAAKRVVDAGAELPLPDALTREQAALSELFAGDDAKEGIAAFIGKRAPRWRGR